jgi:hypothetical protein
LKAFDNLMWDKGLSIMQHMASCDRQAEGDHCTYIDHNAQPTELSANRGCQSSSSTTKTPPLYSKESGPAAVELLGRFDNQWKKKMNAKADLSRNPAPGPEKVNLLSPDLTAALEGPHGHMFNVNNGNMIVLSAVERRVKLSSIQPLI